MNTVPEPAGGRPDEIKSSIIDEKTSHGMTFADLRLGAPLHISNKFSLTQIKVRIR